MGSPLSPVIANLYMEDFEMKAIEKATHKPACWYRYVDDTFVIWPRGQEELTDFLNHLNGIHNNIQFTMETEEVHLSFLDIDIYRKMDGSLGHKVYWKAWSNACSERPWYTLWGLKKQLIPPGSLCSRGWKGRHTMEQRLEAVLDQL